MNYGRHGRELLLELKRTETRLAEEAGGPPPLSPYADVTVAAALQDLQLHVQALQQQVEAASMAATLAGDRPGTNAASSSASSGPPKPTLAVRPSLLMQNAAIQRNKRCLLTYHYVRCQRIQQALYWQNHRHDHSDHDPPQQVSGEETSTTRVGAGSNVSSSSSSMDEGGRNRMDQLCPAEVDFLHSYVELIHRYTASSAQPFGSSSSAQEGSPAAAAAWTLPVAASTEADYLRSRAVDPPVNADMVQVRVVDEAPWRAREGAEGSSSSSTVVSPVVLASGQTVLLTEGSTHYLLYTDVENWIRTGVLLLLDGEEESLQG